MIKIAEKSIIQQTGQLEKNWSVEALLEACDPLSGEPLEERNAAMQYVATIADDSYDSLSETARAHCDFWKNLRPELISEKSFKYSTKVTDTYYYELTINATGLFYKDISGDYNYPNTISGQLFSNFWFYGPLLPLPDLNLREEMLHILRKTFREPDNLASNRHFELFEYPRQTVSILQWVDGDYNRSDFVTVREFGIEMGYTTWRDGLASLGFLSFEQFLTLPEGQPLSITPEIRAGIEDYLGKVSAFIPEVKDEVLPPAVEQQPTPKEKQALARSFIDQGALDEGADILISLLELGDLDDFYWRNYVFNYFYKLRNSRRVQDFILECLQGDNETWFKKSVDVLVMWGIYGDKALFNNTLLKRLNWEDATANDPDFREALESVKRIIKSVSK